MRISLLDRLFGLLTFGGLIAGLALLFAAQRGESVHTTSVSQSPISTPTIVSPAPFTSPLVEPAPTWVVPTLLPDRGVRVSFPSEVTVSDGNVAIELLYHLDVYDDTLVSNAVVQGGVTVVAIDLKTGRAQRLTHVTDRGVQEPHISGHYVTWIESTPELGRDVRQLHVFDLAQAREFTVGQGILYQPDLKDNILVWQEYRGQGWGIYGYDLAADRQFAVVESPTTHSAARVCSKEWIIYLQNVQEGWSGSADLHAHNLTTGEDILIGQMPFPRSGSLPGTQHACGGSRVAWIGMRILRSVEQKTALELQTETFVTITNMITIPIYEQHVYDLDTRSDRVLDMSVPILPSPVLIDGDILISTVGYDLKRDVPFNVLSHFPPEQSIGGELALSDDRLVWTARPGLVGTATPDNPQRLYTAFIIRD